MFINKYKLSNIVKKIIRNLTKWIYMRIKLSVWDLLMQCGFLKSTMHILNLFVYFLCVWQKFDI